MRRIRWTAGAPLAALFLAGCLSGPLQENPLLVRSDKPVAQDNPVYLPLANTPQEYARVFDHVVNVLEDRFEIAYMSRYEGYIETQPRIAAGLEQPWKPGSPDFYQRLLATFQTIRMRALVQISSADDGGYWIDVKVLKELEDLPAPVRATASQVTFWQRITVQRQYEVIDPFLYESSWIPIGRDTKLEQVILECLSTFDPRPPAQPTAPAPASAPAPAPIPAPTAPPPPPGSVPLPPPTRLQGPVPTQR